MLHLGIFLFSSAHLLIVNCKQKQKSSIVQKDASSVRPAPISLKPKPSSADIKTAPTQQSTLQLKPQSDNLKNSKKSANEIKEPIQGISFLSNLIHIFRRTRSKCDQTTASS